MNGSPIRPITEAGNPGPSSSIRTPIRFPSQVTSISTVLAEKSTAFWIRFHSP
jgi:hypothetical protein